MALGLSAASAQILDQEIKSAVFISVIEIMLYKRVIEGYMQHQYAQEQQQCITCL
jgi:hypothetical protein